jgi:hypothetical protein
MYGHHWPNFVTGSAWAVLGAGVTARSVKIQWAERAVVLRSEPGRALESPRNVP